jgi:hypothetical protein
MLSKPISSRKWLDEYIPKKCEDTEVPKGNLYNPSMQNY